MIDAPFALALTAGMVATVNPCGFAMLPAYLAYFVGAEDAADDDEDAERCGRGDGLGRPVAGVDQRERDGDAEVE